MTNFIYAYNNGSKSATMLSQALGLKRIKHEGAKLKAGIVINWGASNIKRELACDKIINEDAAITIASNKLKAFKIFNEERVSIPLFITDKKDAEDIIRVNGDMIVCRTILNGHSGAGIVLASKPEELVDAPLYTVYQKKKEEYRIHVMAGKAFHVQRKARRKDVPDEQVNWKVRNHANGFIFQIEGVDVCDEAKEEAVKAVNALGLHFGAVDIILGTDKRWYVLEVNTAPGIEGTTLDKYVQQFKEILQ